MEVVTQSALETQELGEKMGRDLRVNNSKPKVICLYGELGSGKTTFVQGLAKGWGIKKRVTSPTFVFVKLYQPDFYHVDLYRIEKKVEAKNLGLEEIFNEPQVLVVIEWAEKMKEILPWERQDINFEYLVENQRRITFKTK
ncbi:tRNA (adenosine(37)-N6)-threonylcarbamoyltransferase complex ATPase subunit type 1 TsaE [Candidatus Shapirobacteria bacterium]|nr:tRNA (adenosine(37)-N6)-threonylcarbamoyltransferase complex ATPase subunit type 1 TsaE [Candidatus Shapirobacteria bacterium]